MNPEEPASFFSGSQTLLGQHLVVKAGKLIVRLVKERTGIPFDFRSIESSPGLSDRRQSPRPM